MLASIVPEAPMTEPRLRRVRLTMTLLPMMKLTIFAAVASLCLAPFVRLVEVGAVSWEWMLVGEAMGLPVVLALLAFPLVRRGPFKDWLIRSLLLASVSVGLGFSAYSLLWGRAIWATGVPRGTFYYAIILLSVPFVVLFPKVVPPRQVARAFSADDEPAA
jgi:hypothetical protein